MPITGRWGGVGLALAGVALVLSACGAGGTSTAGAGATAGSGSAAAAASAASAVAANPGVDPGSSLHRQPAPGFELTNQHGQPTSLRQFRGRVVVLAFLDSVCTSVCPLTTQSMLVARSLLGGRGRDVQLLGVNANPQATSVADVAAYSAAHGLSAGWDFLTGSPTQLHSVWNAYHVQVATTSSGVEHEPLVYVIDSSGRERTLYITQMSYGSVTQQAHVLARGIAAVLPGGGPSPALGNQRALSGQGPTSTVSLPRIGAAGTVTLGPGQPHLVVFVASWLQQTEDLRRELTSLNGYVTQAAAHHWPSLVVVDETSTEPSTATAAAFLAGLGPLRYPVVADSTGRVADGYGVQQLPWFVLTTAAGKVALRNENWFPLPGLLAAVARAQAG